MGEFCTFVMLGRCGRIVFLTIYVFEGEIKSER